MDLKPSSTTSILAFTVWQSAGHTVPGTLPCPQDIFYVCKKTLGQLKEKLAKSEEITKEVVTELTFPENLGDDEIM
eukprot:6205502-Amphidinium_carterae.1